MGSRPWFWLLLLCLPAYGQAPTRVVSTIANLADLYPGLTQPHVLVQGFYNSGDWGAPKAFRWDSTNALSTNAIRRATKNGVGRWVHDWDGDPRAFGAIPDDAIEDSAALNAAQVASASGNVPIVFPPGEFIAESLLISESYNWIGPNWFLSISPFQSVGNESITRIKLKNNSTTGRLLTITNGTQGTIVGLTFIGNRANQTVSNWLVRIDKTTTYSESFYRDMIVMDSLGGGMYVSATHAQSFDHCAFVENQGHGAYFNGSQDALIVKSYFARNGLDGFYSDGGLSWRMNEPEAFQNGGNGFTFEDSYLGYVENLISNNNLGHGLALRATSGNTTARLYFYGGQINGNNYPVRADNVTVTTFASGSKNNIHSEGLGNILDNAFFGTIASFNEASQASVHAGTIPGHAIGTTTTGNWFGNRFIDVTATSQPGYWFSNRLSGLTIGTAVIKDLFDPYTHSTLSSLPNSILAIGGSLLTTNPLSLMASYSGDMIRLRRVGSVDQTIGITVSTKDIRFREGTSGEAIATFDLESYPRLYIGGQNGSGSGVPRRGEILAEPATGTNVAGAPLAFVAGVGTGLGTGGTMYWATATPGSATNATANSATTKMALSPEGNLLVGANVAFNTNYSLVLMDTDKVFRPNSMTTAEYALIPTNGINGALFFDRSEDKLRAFVAGVWDPLLTYGRLIEQDTLSPTSATNFTVNFAGAFSGLIVMTNNAYLLATNAVAGKTYALTLVNGSGSDQSLTLQPGWWRAGPATTQVVTNGTAFVLDLRAYGTSNESNIVARGEVAIR